MDNRTCSNNATLITEEDLKMTTQENIKVKVVTSNPKMEAFLFDNIEDAKKVFPDLDPNTNTKTFTWAMKDKHDGADVLRFEDWETYRRMSL